MSATQAERQETRLGAGGLAFILCSGSGRGLAGDARAAFTAVSEGVSDRGGWLVEDGVPGGSATGFAELMTRRAAGALPWETVCPRKTPGGARSRLERKLPHTALVHLGTPCWALERHLYSLDLFNPANELGLPYADHRTFWQLSPWPVRFWSDPTRSRRFGFTPFEELIVRAAEAIDCPLGFGGRGLKEVLSAMTSGHRPLCSGGTAGRITDFTYPFMLVRRDALSEDDVAELTRPSFSLLGGAKTCRPSVAELVGERRQYVLLGLALEPESFPMGDYDLGKHVGSVLGRPYVAAALEEAFER